MVLLNFYFTFMWCLWKSRNDCLFCRKNGLPHQVNMAATALLSNLETHDLSHPKVPSSTREQAIQASVLPPQGSPTKSDFYVTGPKLHFDTTWKPNKISTLRHSKAGLGVYCHFQENALDIDIFIQASDLSAPSPLYAEAHALVLAAKLAMSLQLTSPTFFTDCLGHACGAVVSSTTDDSVLWEIRKQVADFSNFAHQLKANVFHIYREINGVAHNCAQQARRSSGSAPIFSCSNSAHRLSSCPTLASVSNFQMSGIVLHSVYCF